MSLLLFSSLILLATGLQGAEIYKEPQCSKLAEVMACPMNLAPVCGTDGNTYPNECGLCVQRLKTQTNILIAKDGSC